MGIHKIRLKAPFLLLVSVMVICLHSPIAKADHALRVAFGDALPPWVIPSENRGILVDILKQTLEPAGYTIQPLYYPYARRLLSYRNYDVDIASDINPAIIENEGLTGFFSGIVYEYENFAISLKKRNFNFKSISDLRNVSVLSWQGASVLLGPEYAEMAKSNQRYRENHDQELQIKMLFLNRVEVIQLDKEIFKYFRHRVHGQNSIDTRQAIDWFPLFGSNPSGFLFRDRKLRDTFARNFEKLKASEKYQKIYSNYAGSDLTE